MDTNTTVIPEGFYVLARDVESEHMRDKRAKYAWTTYGEWKAGSTWRVTHESMVEGYETVMVKLSPVWLSRVKLQETNQRPHRSSILVQHLNGKDGSLLRRDKTDFDSQFLLAHDIVAALEPDVVTDFDQLASRYNGDACRAILKFLNKRGQLSLGDLQPLFERVENYELYEEIGEPC